MNKVKIAYWAVTALLSLMMLGSGLADILGAEAILQGMAQLGIPLYLMPFFGVLKILGTITILLPQLSRLREGAYAGMLFYAIGAMYVHAATGDWANIGGSVIMFILVIGSYLLSLKARPQYSHR